MWRGILAPPSRLKLEPRRSPALLPTAATVAGRPSGGWEPANGVPELPPWPAVCSTPGGPVMFANRREAGCALARRLAHHAHGNTVRAALRAIRRVRPACLVLAVPVAPPDTLAALRSEVDEVVRLLDASHGGAALGTDP